MLEPTSESFHETWGPLPSGGSPLLLISGTPFPFLFYLLGTREPILRKTPDLIYYGRRGFFSAGADGMPLPGGRGEGILVGGGHL